MKLRSRVILLVLAVLLPAIVGFAWIMARNVQHAKDAYLAQVVSRAHAIRLSMDQELERRETVLRLLTDSPELKQWDLAAFCKLARSTVREDTGTIVLARQGLTHMGTINEDCRPISTGLGRMPEPITSGRVHLSDIFTRSMGDRQMAIFTDIVHDGAIYQLAMGVLPAALQDRLELNQFDAGWSAAVMNPIGRVLARVPDPDAWVGRMAVDYAADPNRAADFWRAGIGPEEGVLTGKAADGTQTQIVFSRSDRYGLTVFLAFPQAVAEETAHGTVMEETLVITALMMFALLAALWAGRKIAAPAIALGQTAEALKAGHPVALQRFGVPEFDSVASSLEEASVTIRSHSEELTRKVDEAVTEAKASQLKLLQAQKLEVIGRLTGGIAHDFNNLLQTLSTGLTVLEQIVRDPKAKPLVEAGLRAVGRASRLVRQLLAIGRNAPFDRQAVDLQALLLGMEVLLSRTLPRNIRFRIGMPPGLWFVMTDPSQLEVALLNVVFNARDAMPDGGSIRIVARNEVRDGRDGVLLQVIDDGKGIAPELLSAVFEPFVTTKPEGRGTGLGLSQVKDFVQASEGTVALDSLVGRGTTVLLWLPRAMDAPAEELLATDRALASQGGTVLLVEDDALIEEVVSGALRNAGFDIRICPTADHALRRLRAGERVDVVFSDIVMSGSLSGLQLVDILKRDFPALPVILATGFADALVDPPPCLLLSKPYSLQRLIDVLNEACQTPRQETPP